MIGREIVFSAWDAYFTVPVATFDLAWGPGNVARFRPRGSRRAKESQRRMWRAYRGAIEASLQWEADQRRAQVKL